MNGRSQLISIGVVSLLIIAGLIAYIVITTTPTSPEAPVAPTPVPEPIVPEVPAVTTAVIGQSVEGRAIQAITFGTGDTHLLFVGGIHGGYEWNSALLAYEMIDYLESNHEIIPENLAVSIIPDLNPDGTVLALRDQMDGRFVAADVVDPTTRLARGRFNAHDVDLNRNFDCKWAPESTWRGNPVSAGTGPFSEPEAAALRDFVFETEPTAVVFWHSQANNVYASECEEGVLPATLTLMSTYATAADYGEVPVFDAYPITGDAEGWLASIGIPAITVELESFRSIEWSRNLAGVNAMFDLYAN